MHHTRRSKMFSPLTFSRFIRLSFPYTVRDHVGLTLVNLNTSEQCNNELGGLCEPTLPM